MTDTTELESILAMTNTDVDEVVHLVRSNVDTLFTWDYERSRPALSKLYEKAKRSQWNASTDLDWSIEVDEAKEASLRPSIGTLADMGMLNLKGTPVESWDKDKWLQFEIETAAWSISQFLHGEQGALICTA